MAVNVNNNLDQQGVDNDHKLLYYKNIEGTEIAVISETILRTLTLNEVINLIDETGKFREFEISTIAYLLCGLVNNHELTESDIVKIKNKMNDAGYLNVIYEGFRHKDLLTLKYVTNFINYSSQFGYKKKDIERKKGSECGLDINYVTDYITQKCKKFNDYIKKQKDKKFNDHIKKEDMELKAIDLANTLNGLAQLGYKKEDFSNKFKVNIIVETINNKIDEFSSIDLANTFNGLAQLGYKKGDFSDKLNLKDAIRAINRNCSSFNCVDLGNLINGLGKLGYTKKDFEDASLTIYTAINANVKEMSIIVIGNVINGLA